MTTQTQDDYQTLMNAARKAKLKQLVRGPMMDIDRFIEANQDTLIQFVIEDNIDEPLDWNDSATMESHFFQEELADQAADRMREIYEIYIAQTIDDPLTNYIREYKEV